MAQEKTSDYFISYSLHPDWIKDITRQKFWYPLSPDTMQQGITPFALQKLNTWLEADIFLFEETAQQATHVTMEDINHQNQKGAKPAPTNPHGFLKLLTNTHAISSILFGPKLPLTIGLEKIYCTCCIGQGEHSILSHLANTQTDWFAHVLWTITREMNTFFCRSLSPTKLANRIKLESPLQSLLPTINSFGAYCQADTLDCLKARNPRQDPYVLEK